MSSSNLSTDVEAMERQAADFERRGQPEAAFKLWQRIIELAPSHVSAMLQLGLLAGRMGDHSISHHWLGKACQADPARIRSWIHLAAACERMGDEAGQESALFKALSLDPYDIHAHLMRGRLFEHQGKSGQAVTDFGAALAGAPPLDRVPADLRQALEHARSFLDHHESALAKHLDQRLSASLEGLSVQAAERFRYSVDILVGRKKRYESQPVHYLVPQLPAIEFFDRSWFPWMDELESRTEAIRDEFMTVWREDHAAFSPYIEYGADQPVAQWAELNHNPQWSVLHLVKGGEEVTANAQRCPKTVAAAKCTPQPVQFGRTPVVFFSLLKPKARIPPHVGASNARLVVHLPLIVPDDCGFRVGNITRPWVPGQAWVFDDTIEHEAWNNSTQTRAILIFDTWNPLLSADERRLITELNVALSEFGRGESPVGYDS